MQHMLAAHFAKWAAFLFKKTGSPENLTASELPMSLVDKKDAGLKPLHNNSLTVYKEPATTQSGINLSYHVLNNPFSHFLVV